MALIPQDSVLLQRDTRVLALSCADEGRPCKDTEGHHLHTRKRAVPRTQAAGSLILDIQSLEP